MSYGSIQLMNRYWCIVCEPQVRARLKRVFPRMPQWAADKIHLAATAENSRELQWFMGRYPMDMTADDLHALQLLSAEHVAMEKELLELKAGHIPLPAFELAKPPREYQRFAGAQLAIRGGLLLADDLGLGKTVSGICPMAVPGNLPAVVVYPAHLPNHWPEKLAEFAPHLRVHHCRTSKPYPLIKQPRQRLADLWDTLPDVILLYPLEEIAQYAKAA